MSAYVQTLCGSDSPPIGAVMDFAGNVEPSGWLFCWGQSLPTTGIYADLYAVIGTTYGGGGGNFNLPDFRGRVGAGKDDMGGVAANRLTSAWGVNGVALGANGGTESHLLTTAQLAAHAHTEMRVQVIGSGGNINTASGTTANSTYTQNTGLTGGGEAHPNVQPTAIINKIIKYTIAAVVLPIVPGTGDVTGPDGGVADGGLAVYNGSSGKVLKGSSLVAAVPVGGVVQTQANSVGFDSTQLVIPFDTTPPQITEGKQYMSCSITPVYASSKIWLSVTGSCSHSGASAYSTAVAMFRVGVSDCLVSSQVAANTASYTGTLAMQIEDSPATTNPVTYTVRFGTYSGSVTVFMGGRGDAGGAFGGTMKSYLTVQEIKQ